MIIVVIKTKVIKILYPRNRSPKNHSRCQLQLDQQKLIVHAGGLSMSLSVKNSNRTANIVSRRARKSNRLAASLPSIASILGQIRTPRSLLACTALGTVFGIGEPRE